ncbi:hypothetical protein ALP73_200062 [Pseudomonas coronafaciens pv. garcae]|uniref:Type VI secretion protein n=1 Tax=Pseudomonas coronafaciens pv. garcae TaxID=251653 RepID=A0AB37QN65_9PSED|nr:Uncharacterized protein AC511_1770 [Pseudomonas coronafaciens pv. oryzae]KPY17324.1 hypothetical protein ALO89_00210 [Pseudomonas coronafaciens pv. porri]QIQ74707.1 hypothetical protein HBB04_05128 [Pseudomonas coronafaciens]RMN26887.1 hypothetical protein ALQ62_200239 [Pseudomonas coronafaciens pv. zizaniae]RMR98290.1 hypothetical protein ALP74_200142 [Pseudomonas coronafaciens pv. garcae]
MTIHCWRTLPFVMTALICLGGCTGHFIFSDDQYRTLGNPAPATRNQ